jgi:hypothetical protein
MSSDLEVMHKILKNEENRKILCILNEKEALTLKSRKIISMTEVQLLEQYKGLFAC